MKLGIFGGTFDPIHNEHLSFAEKAIEKCGIDKIVFVPCKQSPHKHKKTVANALQRMEMVRMSIRHNKNFVLANFDLRSKKKLFAWEVLREIQQNPFSIPYDSKYYWLMGGDQWKVINQWAKPEILARDLIFVVGTRGEEAKQKDGFKMISFETENNVSATQIREGDEKFQKNHLTPEVFDYIKSNGLYRQTRSD